MKTRRYIGTMVGALALNGINNAGRIVGFFEDGTKNTVGFVGKPLSS